MAIWKFIAGSLELAYLWNEGVQKMWGKFEAVL